MRHGIHKKAAALLCSILTAAGLIACENSSSQPSDNHGTVATDPVTVTAFDVGKADAFVVQTAGSVTVIDTGNKGDGKQIEKFLTAQGIGRIDTLIITHFDRDHVGGAARLVNRMEIGEIYVPNYECDAEDYRSFIKKTEEQHLTVNAVPMRDEISWRADDAAFRLYAANETFYGNNEENDFSLALLIQHGTNSFLFAGDAEDARQRELMALGIAPVTFLKFPYHGNYLPCTEEFLDLFQPQVAVVCCSKKEFADPSTVETLEKRGVETYYTNNGTVTIVSDGDTLACEQSDG